MKYLLVLFLLLPSIVFAESYLCLGEVGGGIVFDTSTNQWRGAAFDAKTKKFIFKKPNTNIEYLYIVNRLGHDIPEYFCKEDFNSYGNIICYGLCMHAVLAQD